MKDQTITLRVSGLLTYDQACEALGISRPTLYERLKAGRLHTLAIGGRNFLLASEVDFLKASDLVPEKTT